ncbi:recombinase family protein [Pedobacter hiemivivus]|uniref:Recombinase family protein n=1 Tax=Pedobacter hiemivivus TaxID=2530454 RepID=A0A4U1G3I5_9SPHI|nr:recombinase family protein [Pedobacter hiemivivus]TKC57150.1 recombinase family protein [Pedobacter hiemivivus]
MRIADLYIRVSTDEQAEKGYSQRDQEERLTRYCEFNNITVRKVIYEDHSAKTFNRPTWGLLLADLRKNKGRLTDLVLFTKWDRFSRNAGDAYNMISVLRNLGIEPQAIEQPLDLSIPENKLMLAIYLSTPEVENDRRALNVINGMRKAKKEGRWMSTAPVGYRNITTEDGRKLIVPKEPQASLIKYAFEKITTGMFSTEQIWKVSKANGLKSGKNNFLVAMRNPVYCGKLFIPKYKDEESQLVKGIHEPLISEKLFYEVQDVMDGRKKKQATKVFSLEELPLRGFLYCSKCTRMLTGSASKGRNRYYYYYHCSSSCGCRYKAEDVNNAILKDLKSLVPKAGMAEVCAKTVNEMYHSEFSNKGDSKKEIISKIDALNNKIKTARELLLSGDLDGADYKAVKIECEDQITTLENKLFDASSPKINIENQLKDAVNVLLNLDLLYKNGTVAIKREIIGSIFPEKLSFDGTQHRTTRVNEVVSIICMTSNELGSKKKRANDLSKCLPALVGHDGLEPFPTFNRGR